MTASTIASLAALHDIHIPTAIGFWPLAIGWQILISLVFFGSLGLGLWYWRAYRRARFARTALRMIDEYYHQYLKNNDAHQASLHLSGLLRRVALAYYPRQQVAGLTGDAWIMFLNQTAHQNGLDFTKVREELLVLPYQPRQSGNIELLFQLARRWIRPRRVPCLN